MATDAFWQSTDERLNVSAMKILLSEGAMTALTRLGGYVIESRGHIDIKVRAFMHCLHVPGFQTLF